MSRRCQSSHCVCCGAGATMTVERKAGLVEPLCAACCVKLWLSTGYRLASVKIKLPCACRPEANRVFRVRQGPRVESRFQRNRRLRLEAMRLHKELQREDYMAIASWKRARVERIVRVVAARYRMGPASLYVRSNIGAIAGPRGVAMYMLSKESGMSLSAISRHFRMHHATAIHHVHRLEELMESSDALRGVIAEMRSSLHQEPHADELVHLMALPVPDARARTTEVTRYLPGFQLKPKPRYQTRKSVRRAEAEMPAQAERQVA